MQVLDLAIAIAGLASGLWLLWHIPTCRPRVRRVPGDADGVSVIIPARNEESRLPTLLRSLATQTLPAREVLVVDDGSSDATADLARSFGATVLAPGDLPVGWAGKPWACWNGALAAAGSILVFLDADVVLSPDGLARLVQEQQRRGGLLSVQPYHTALRAYEQLSAWFNLVLMMGLGAFTPLGERVRPAGAFGPCVLCRREEYLLSGGHRAAAREVLEDIELGRAFHRAGYAVHCLGGRDTVTFRMYPDGFGQMLEGWSKGFAVGASRVGLSTLVPTILWISGCSGSAVALARMLEVSLSDVSSVSTVLEAAMYLAFAVQIRWMLRRIGSFRWWAWALYPVPLAFFIGLFVWSLWLTFARKRVSWRGRVLDLRRSASVEQSRRS
jgi:4,4'-diaponeurosporenoate glycosyltransferase